MKKFFIVFLAFITTQTQASFYRKAALYTAAAAYSATAYPAIRLAAFLGHQSSKEDYTITAKTDHLTPEQAKAVNNYANNLSRYGNFTNTTGPIGLLLAPPAFWTLIGYTAWQNRKQSKRNH